MNRSFLMRGQDESNACRNPGISDITREDYTADHVDEKNIDETRLQAKPGEGEWSVKYILAHLRSCADVWGDQIDKIIAKDQQKLPYAHPRQWIKKTNYRELPFYESFRAFKLQRRKLLKMLRELSFEDWSRGATIKGREHTIFTHVRRMAKHEDVHCQQIKEVLE